MEQPRDSSAQLTCQLNSQETYGSRERQSQGHTRLPIRGHRQYHRGARRVEVHSTAVSNIAPLDAHHAIRPDGHPPRAMDHSGHNMDHSGHSMDHSGHNMDHSGHNMSAMDAASAVVNASLAAATTAASELATAVHQHVTGQDMAAAGSGTGHGAGMAGHDHAQHVSAGAATGGHAVGHTGGHGGHGGHGGMSMTFHFGVSEYVLFDAWHVTTVGGMVASCLGLFIVALLYEGLKYKREDLLRKNATREQFDTIRVPSDGGVTEVTTVSNSEYGAASHDAGERGSEGSDATESRPITASGRRSEAACARQRMLSKHHFLQTFLHAVQVVVGYFLMLAFMTYNVWLGIAIVLGAAAGYFIFGSKKFVVVDVTEHCH
ncbi:uncharacterized protein LOC119099831 isoform X2 [Pollicipes pollicipes]|uniref:uncharacterized protein LOC119099831 isoform X2 n=1 Tax=Pollicipes pollicipes TaxID=41117 RepID=UPI001884C5BC|nr:uncharacterized protein LOC119099831 isoform X2 [Pollicipes pollicipes]